jgi:negative regulator of replication initiation
MYVYGRFDAKASQLENAIVAEGRREKLRVVGVNALLNLLELKQEYGLAHATVLGLLRPAPVRIDPLINLISDVVAQEREDQDLEAEEDVSEQRAPLAVEQDQPSPERRGRRRVLRSIEEDYTGQTVTSVTFKGRSHEVNTWKGAAVELFILLCNRDWESFESAALSIVGRKRPYFSYDRTKLRQPAQIPNTELFFEANLSANSLVKLCYTVIEKVGLARSVLSFEAEP